jgi:hypothetical protein
MAINSKNAPKSGKTIPAMEAGSYPSRIVIIADLGLQPQFFDKEEKEPKREISITYEHVDEFLKDDDGEDLTNKPRWNTERFALNHIDNKKAKSTIRYSGLDPNNIHDGDWKPLLGMPCTVTLAVNPGQGANKGRDFNKVMAASAMRAKDAEKCAPLVNAARYFDLDEPDIEVFYSLPNFIQEKIKGNLNFKGSELEKLIAANPKPEQVKKEDHSVAPSKRAGPPKAEKSVKEDLDDEIPY